MDRDTFAWLLTDAGQQLLAEATRLYDEGIDPLTASTTLRALASAERAAAALTQATLRAAGQAKLGEAARSLYFTRDGLEQATRLRVSRHRAARLALAAPPDPGWGVADLGCGIGGDLIALSEAGLTVAGVDLDPLRADIAAANLAALGLPGAVAVADATTLALDGFGAVFADPARRTGAGRVFGLEDYRPPWSFVLSLMTRPAVVKVAPGIAHADVPDGAEAEWVSDDGDLKEASIWSPALATVARRATVVRATGLATLTDEDEATDDVVALRGHLYEPDDAVIRAGLVTAVAAVVDGGLPDPHIAYVTSDDAVATPFARGYRVLDELPYKEKQLKAALRARHVGRLTIKKRGVDVEPSALRRRLDLSGDEEATIVLTRIAGEGTALLVQPLGD